MTNLDMIARLADLREFAELKTYFDELREESIARLGQKSFALPAEHDQLEWERLNAFYRGVSAALNLPVKLRDKKEKSSE